MVIVDTSCFQSLDTGTAFGNQGRKNSSALRLSEGLYYRVLPVKERLRLRPI